MPRVRRPSEPPAGQVDDLGGAGQAEAQAASRLPPAVERVEQMGRLAGPIPLPVSLNDQTSSLSFEDERT